jgi:hypothetical protein
VIVSIRVEFPDGSVELARALTPTVATARMTAILMEFPSATTEELIGRNEIRFIVRVDGASHKDFARKVGLGS